jgi:hypothetical protein
MFLGFGIRLKIWLAVFALGALIGGFAKLADSMRFRSAQKVSVEQFIQSQPKQGWYDITGGYLDIANSVVSTDESDGYYVPLRSNNDAPGGPIQIFVFVGDDKTVRLIDAYNNASNRKMTLWGTSHWSQLGKMPSTTSIPMEVSGLVHDMAAMDGNEAEHLQSAANSNGPLLDIHQGEHPNAFVALALIGGGLVFCYLSLLSFGINLDFTSIKDMLQGRKAAATGPDLARYPGSVVSNHYNQSGYAPPPPVYTGQQQPGYPPQPAPFTQTPPNMGGQQHYPQQGSPEQTPYAPPPAPAPPAPELDQKTAKEQEELAKLREMKPFDPFS